MTEQEKKDVQSGKNKKLRKELFQTTGWYTEYGKHHVLKMKGDDKK